ncbi:MAG: GNAT family N-acetyltransferase [Thermoplasmataceae archaeon]
MRRDDIGKPFFTRDSRMRAYSMKYFYEWSTEPDTLVLVIEGKGNVLEGVVVLKFVPGKNNPRSIVVEMLSRNQLEGLHNSGVGADIIQMVENYIAKPLGCAEIVIEAVNDLTDYYSSLGYSRTGHQEYDDFWGKVVYMKKRMMNEQKF